MRRAAVTFVLAVAILSPSGPATSQVEGPPVAVTLLDVSVPTRCAEEDNVDLRLQGTGVRTVRILAVPPPYTPLLTVNAKDPDFTDCGGPGDEPPPPPDASLGLEPRTEVLYEDDRQRLVGLRFGAFWREADVPVTVPDGRGGSRRADGLHLLQLFTKSVGPAPVEYLVLYPPDGYWRAKPLPPPNLDDNAYGTSFLIGPIEDLERPVVRLSSVAFDPGGPTGTPGPAFRLGFVLGGGGTLRVDALHATRAEMTATFDAPVPADRPFAGVRSMFVTPDNADAAEIQVRHAVPGPWTVWPVLTIDRIEGVQEARIGRTRPSRHNIAAPDMVFGPFGR